MNDALDLLREIDPPPGGLDGLRRRLARHARRRAAIGRSAFAAATLALVLGGSLAVREATRPPAVPAWAAESLLAVELGLVEVPDEPVSIPRAARNRLAIRRVDTSDPRVVLYLAGRL